MSLSNSFVIRHAAFVVVISRDVSRIHNPEVLTPNMALHGLHFAVKQRLIKKIPSLAASRYYQEQGGVRDSPL